MSNLSAGVNKRQEVLWRSQHLSKFCLGTVQLGAAYGVANRTGQPDQNGINEIVKTAWNFGIDLFDTGQAYGTSEEVLGNAFAALGISNQVKVITKISPVLETKGTEAIVQSVRSSLKRLRIPKLFSVMLHRGEWLKKWEIDYAPAIRKIMNEGLAESAGVSLYTLDEFEEALKIPEIVTIQMPFNLLDQRVRLNRCFERAAEKGKLFFLRSIYLQGALTVKSSELPEPLKFAAGYFKKCQELADILDLSLKELAFRFVFENSQNAVVVFGVETAAQLFENMRIAQSRSSFGEKTAELFCLGNDVPKELINPALWESNENKK